MANIQEIEKEIMLLQEKIEASLNELNKPRGLMAKYAKICEFENGNFELRFKSILFLKCLFNLYS
jgi:hypothetical protein